MVRKTREYLSDLHYQVKAEARESEDPEEAAAVFDTKP
jgi:hypothetical protein